MGKKVEKNSESKGIDLTTDQKHETAVEKNEGENQHPALNMDALTEDENFPEVKENAIQAVNQQKETEKLEAQKLEASGVKLNKDGSIAKKRGRKAGSETKFKNPDEIAQPNQQISPSLEAGIVISGILEQLSVTLISDDFKLEQHEREHNIGAWVKCLDYYGGVEISPPMALAMSHASIIMVRANKEKTKTKFGLAKAWFKNKIANWKGGKNALSNSRPNDVGQDDIRKEESAKS